MTLKAPTRARGARHRDRVDVGQSFLAGPMADFSLVLVIAVLLVALGLVMVTSSSSVYASVELGAGSYYFSMRQGLFLLVGIPVAWWLSRMNPATLKTGSWLALSGVVLLLIATLLLGSDEGKGNQAWLSMGPISLQPSEFAKPVLIVWAAGVWANRRRHLNDVRVLLFPVLAAFLVVLGLVAMQGDLGTAMIIGIIMMAMLFFVGANWRVITPLVLAALLGVAALVATNPNRMNRIFGFLGRQSAAGTNDQAQAAIYALATGGWFGVGIGASRQKYGALADAAHNDFIFAVLGEEMGLVGVLIVLALFLGLAYAGIRIALRSTTLFDRVLASSLTVWIIAQALVNILVATGLAPVMGITLPFVSYGGSSLLACMAAIGLLLGCARREPDAAAARAAKGKRPRVTAVMSRSTRGGSRADEPRHGRS